MASTAEFALAIAVVGTGVAVGASFILSAPSGDLADSEVSTYCFVVDQRLPKYDCDDLKKSLNNTQFGIAKIKYQKQIYIDEVSPVQLTVQFLQKNKEFHGAENANFERMHTEKFKLKVGRHMKSELVAQGLHIKTLNDSDQKLSRDGIVSWEWELKAPQEGAYTLNFKTSVQGITANGDKYVLVPTVETRKVIVKTTFKQNIGSAFNGLIEWLKNIENLILSICAIISALILLKVGRRKLSKKGS